MTRNFGQEKCENGFTTIWIIGLCAVCLIVVFGVLKLGNAVHEKSLVQSAADAAALSAAYDVSHSKIDRACNSARLAAKKNLSQLNECRTSYSEVYVRVSLVSDPKISAKARAEID